MALPQTKEFAHPANALFKQIQELVEQGIDVSKCNINQVSPSVIEYSVPTEYTEESKEQFLKDAANYWKEKRKQLRKEQEEKERKRKQKEKDTLLRNLREMGVSQDTFIDLVKGKL